MPVFSQAGGQAVVVEITVPTMTAREGLACVPRLVELMPELTAVFCANDMLALGVLRGLTRLRIGVPDDISLVGYDDDDFAEVLSPPLTTIRQDPYAIGRQAAEKILAEPDQNGGPWPRVVMLEPELIVRDSVIRLGNG